jgi:signal transduction histidine kinase
MNGLPGAGIRHWLPLAFVIAVLLVLGAMPVVSERRISSYETHLNETVEPARAAITDLYLAHGIASGALRQYIASGSPEVRSRYDAALASEMVAVARLAPYVAGMNDRVRTEYALLRDVVDRWGNEWADLMSGERPPDAALLLRSNLDEQAVTAAARLDRELAREGERLRMQVLEAKQNEITLAAILLLLALLAAIIVGWAGRRMHVAGLAAEQARADLVHVNESRARLMRGFSHDVKNPLNAADGYAQLLQDELLGPLTPDQSRGVQRQRAALQAAVGLIDDLVDLARAETGQIDLQLERFDVVHLVRELVEEYAAAAAAKGQHLEVRASTPLAIESDRPRVRQILSNLFSNAVKYTQEGGSVSARAESMPARRDVDPQRWVQVSIQDNGPGIPRDRQHLLFREFTRLDPATSKGAGLGLAISQGLAHALGGKITVRSEPGHGSTFTLWLPDNLERPSTAAAS